MRIASIVSRKQRNFKCVGADAPLSDAVALMHWSSIGSVGVLGNRPSEFAGLLSQTELTAAIARDGAQALGAPVSSYMRRQVLSCHGEDDANTILRRMTDERCRHAVVRTLTGAVAGLVSLGDLVAAMLEEARLEAGVLRDMARSRLLALPG